MGCPGGCSFGLAGNDYQPVEGLPHYQGVPYSAAVWATCDPYLPGNFWREDFKLARITHAGRVIPISSVISARAGDEKKGYVEVTARLADQSLLIEDKTQGAFEYQGPKVRRIVGATDVLVPARYQFCGSCRDSARYQVWYSHAIVNNGENR